MTEVLGAPLNFAPAEDSSPALPCSWPGEGCTARLILTREGPDRLLRGPGSPQTGSTVLVHCLQKKVGFLEGGKWQ